MQTKNEFLSLLRDLVTDVRDIDVLWQMAVLLASLGLAWLLKLVFAKRIISRANAEHTLKISMGSMNRLMFPVSALLLVFFGRWVLKFWQPTHLLNIAIPLLFALALIRIAVYMLRRVFSGQEWMRPWERFIGWAVWLGVALYLTGLLPEIQALLDDISFSVGKQRISALLVLQGTLSVLVTMLLALWLGSALEERVMGADTMDMNLRVMLSKIMRAGLIFLGILIALPLVGVDITVLSVFGGALGVGLGLGLQKIASNYVSGFIILLDRSLHIGDIITVENRKGRVLALTTRYVVIKSADGTEALIPNDTFVTTAVINQTYSDRNVRLMLPVQVSYASPLETAMSIVLEAAKKQSQVLADPAPKVFLKEFADNGINLQLDIWIDDPEGGQLPLRSDINLEIWREFQKHGIQIPFPQREVRIIGAATEP